MIREFSSRVNASNNKAKLAFFALLGAAALVTVVYMLVPVYKGVVGTGVLVLIVAAVFIYSKYLGSVFFYDITFDYRGEPILVVRQVTGRRQSTLARVGLREIRSVSMEDAAARKAHQTPKGYKKYVYTPTLGPDTTCRLTVVGAYESSEVVIECSPEFAEMLRAYAAEAKTMTFSEYDEEGEEGSEG